MALGRWIQRMRGRGDGDVAPSTRSSVAVGRLPAREPVPRRLPARLRFYARRVPVRLMTVLSIVGMLPLLYLLGDFVLRSDYFTVQEWQTFGTRRLGLTDIRTAATGLTEQDELNIWRFSVRTAEERLAQHPGVFHARVRKAWPNRIEVLVHEREERAVLVTATAAFLVDVDGVVFARASGREVLDERLPLLTVPDSMSFDLGDRLAAEFFDLAMIYRDVLATMDGPLAGKLSELHWSPTSGLTLFMDDGTRLLCGTLPPAQTLPKFEALMQKTRGRAMIDYADLRVPTDLPWRAVEPPSPPPTVARRR
ncbi:MAG: cell division protein FtsQ/DivIB [Candidatus Sumerlaeia bacterium]|nr:cell division protein FtsQ/DivIB [Candidatus Sumerlaeia bacterium]